MNVGAAFQLVDDLLDFTAANEVLGKPAGADLLEGKITLPLIYLLENEPQIRGHLQEIMLDGSYDSYERSLLIDALERTGALEHAKDRAVEYADRARESLKALPPSKFRGALESIPSYILDRDN